MDPRQTKRPAEAGPTKGVTRSRGQAQLQARVRVAPAPDRLSALYEFAPVGYLTLDGACVIRESNLAAAELLGLPRSELNGSMLASFVPPSKQDALQVSFQNAWASDKKFNCEIAMCRADRSPLRVRVQSNSLGQDQSDTRALHVALIDVTPAAQDRARLRELNRDLELVVAERTAALSESLARLQTNEERLRLALEAGAMGTFAIDIASQRAYCDERHERLYARTPKPEGHPLTDWLDALHPEDHERMVALMKRVMQGVDTELAAEYRIVWPDGSEHWLVVRGHLFFDEHGAPASVAGIEQDIDERKHLEMEVLRIADVEQRRIGQELHDDIQQRLTGLGLMAENLRERLAGKPGAEHALSVRLAQEMSEVSERVHRLARGLVTLNLDGEGLSEALSRLARATDVPDRLRCDFSGEPGLEIRDGFVATHLYRIAQEALTNAIRHSGASRITLSLGSSGRLTVLTVADNGRGIERRKSEGRGMRIMAYRASLIGAALKVTGARSSSSASGLKVSCTVALGPRGGGRTARSIHSGE